MLFVSLKTVEKHLGGAFVKLRIQSRRELGAALAPGEARTAPGRGGRPAR
jgi:DNA-binding NarL/FixJ family response regulator